MIDISKGRYWDLPLTLVSSCTRVSEGCRNCWALGYEKRFHKGVEGIIQTHPERLSIPLKRKKPTVWAVWNDLFHEDVYDGFITDTFHFIDLAWANDHVFLILTKRPHVMLAHVKRSRMNPEDYPHIYWGLTICNQAEADEKIPIFLQVPGKKFLSIEPMLGAIDLTDLVIKEGPHSERHIDCLECDVSKDDDEYYGETISAVILGGETGPGARPMHPEWVRSVRDQCESTGVPFFFKSWGKFGPNWLNDDNGKMIPETEVMDKGCGGGRILDARTHDDLTD